MNFSLYFYLSQTQKHRRIFSLQRCFIIDLPSNFLQHKFAYSLICSVFYPEHLRMSGIFRFYHVPEHGVMIAAVDKPYSVYTLCTAQRRINSHLCLIAIHAMEIDFLYSRGTHISA